MSDLIEKCQQILQETWSGITKGLVHGITYNVIAQEELRLAIQRSINSKTKSYRYVLPTQLVAKVADSSLDSRCIQAGRGSSGDFDARSICDEVIVPFERENHNVLGGAPEPYVNNPLRVPEVSNKYRTRQKDKQGWDDLIFVLEQIETKKDPDFTKLVLEQTLIEIYKRLAEVQVVYPVPKRISLESTQQLISRYISAPSGGERVLTIVSALMKLIGEKFNLFTDVRRRSITSADAQTGLVADIECRDAEGLIRLAVEVKDKELVFNHIAFKLPDMRAKRVSEILYVAQHGVREKNGKQIQELINKEFVSGQNIYIFKDVLELSSGILAILGEDGRRTFLENVGVDLDRYGAAIQHRKDWANLLSQM